MLRRVAALGDSSRRRQMSRCQRHYRDHGRRLTQKKSVLTGLSL